MDEPRVNIGTYFLFHKHGKSQAKSFFYNLYTISNSKIVDDDDVKLP